MELPIRIMIVLFVAMIVGTIIVTFSREMIEESRKNLIVDGPGSQDIDDDKIIALNTVDDQQIIDLILACYDRHHGKTFEKELCFAVQAKTGAWTWANVESYFTSNEVMNAEVAITDDVNDNDYAMYINFDPFGTSETIELAK